MNARVIGIVADRYTEFQRYSVAPLVQRLKNEGYGVVFLMGRDLDTVNSSFEFPSHTTVNICEKASKLDISGFILIGSSLTLSSDPDNLEDHIEPFLAKPTVCMGSHSRDFPNIVADSESSMRELMEHMTSDPERENYVFIRGKPTHFDSRQRERIFRETLEARSITIREDLFITGNFEISEAYSAMCALLSRTTDIDAVIAANDAMAIAAVVALQEFGKRVPVEVIVSGFDSHPAGTQRFLQITTIDPNFHGQGNLAVDTLLDRIHKAKSNTTKQDSLATKPPSNKTFSVPTRFKQYESSLINNDEEHVLASLTTSLEGLLSAGKKPVTPTSIYGIDIEALLNMEVDGFIDCLDQAAKQGSTRAVDVYEKIRAAVKSKPECATWFSNLQFTTVRYLEVMVGASWATAGQAVLKDFLAKIYQDVEFTDEKEKFTTTRQNDYLVRLHIILAACPDVDHILSSMNQFFEVMNVNRAFIALDSRFFEDSEEMLCLVQKSAKGKHTLANGPTYPAHKIFPPGYKKELEGNFITVTPLRYESVEYGYLAIDPTNSRISDIEAIADSICLALRSHDLMQNLRQQTQRLTTSNHELTRLANTDSLTGLPNRKHFDTQLDTLITKCASAHTQFALIYIDLDGFKGINDLMGHKEGDLYLVDVADSITSALGPDVFTARLGGDEFLILLNIPQHTDTASEYLEKTSIRLNHAIRTCSQHYSSAIEVTASIGIACYPKDGTDGQTLIKSADTAMYQAKKAGKNQVKIFDAKTNSAWSFNRDSTYKQTGLPHSNH